MLENSWGLTFCFSYFLICSFSKSLQNLPAKEHSNNPDRDKNIPSVIITTSEYVYEGTNISSDWWAAVRYCELKFGHLPFEVPESDLVDLGKLQLLNNINGPIWLNQKDKTIQNGLRMLPVLIFQNKTNTKFVKILLDFPAMSAVTVCARVQWDNTNREISAVFSYAVPTFMNELQLRGWIDEDGFVRLALMVHGHHSAFLPIFKSDGQWHHFCVTWQKWNGSWEIYADGEKKKVGDGLHTLQEIYGHGTFIIGQDQDSLGGSYREKEAFSGNITDLYIWKEVLSGEQIARVYSCCSLEHELVFAWNNYSLEIEPTVQEITIQLSCPGLRHSSVQDCGTLNAAKKEFSFKPCTEPLRFICQYQKDVYMKLISAKPNSGSAFLERVNDLADNPRATGNVFMSTEKLNISEAVDVLKATQTALKERNITMESGDLLSVMQFLRNVADIGTKDHENPQALQNLSYYFINVADAIFEEQHASIWADINQVVQGPMQIVQNIDRMATNLNQLMNDERKSLHIKSTNIEIDVKEVELSHISSSSGMYVAKNVSSERDQIGVPPEEIARLAQRGLTKVTFINTWYGSIQHLHGHGKETTAQGATVSDGGYKFLHTQVGSAVISSTVLANNEEVSTAVRYQLQHKTQSPFDVVIEPICVFWDFNLRPEMGGSWSSEGCSAISSNPVATSCFCNHTTNFALLLQVYEIQRNAEDEMTLRTLTFIGCGISFCCLIVTLVLFTAVRVPKSERTTVHKNLIFALAAAEALLMFSELASSNKAVCTAVTAFLHLFFMAAFAWMLVEGLLLWSKVVAVNMSEDKRMKFYYLTGWGMPFLIVGITLASSFDKYVADGYCWLNVQSDIIWAFVGPVLFVLTVNTFVLFRVVMVTVSSARRRTQMLAPKCSHETQLGNQIWAAAKPVIVLLPVLGLTWFCGILVHLSLTLAYIFIGMNSFQGLYIFLVYAVYNSEVRHAIKRIKEKKKALSFTNCSHPISYLSSPRTTTSWDTGKLHFSFSNSTSAEKKSAMKSHTNKGEFGPETPVSFSRNLTTEKSRQVVLQVSSI
ncbi:adhesion G-protein coupled receptor D2 isoform X2 [Protopterus annectens]|uniref:adhesion G-protein coupled receptor D2 isoform X2 n=1 Tax=Protopterus annectens TaxID=7888 RepID=UPI001CFA140C|nr:adhesion G-protein coupled receptor D2 isoform X2 [Protopterus annectens]